MLTVVQKFDIGIGMEQQIITRQEALTHNLNHYFTGAACKNGHVARRYVQSSTCVECINGDKIITDAQRESRTAHQQRKLDIEERKLQLAEERLKQRQEEQARRLELAQQRAQRQEKSVSITDDNRAVRGVSTVAKSEFIKIKLRVQPNDVTAMRAFIHGLAIMRIPGIRLIDVCPDINFKGYSVHTFLVHPEDRDLAFKAQDDFERTNMARKEERRLDIERVTLNLEIERRKQQEDNNGDPGDTLENLMR
jgi:hypothetical protein